ncbi:MAG: hypothetical protein U0271_31370 [Polyangiaceae bacterium]
MRAGALAAAALSASCAGPAPAAPERADESASASVSASVSTSESAALASEVRSVGDWDLQQLGDAYTNFKAVGAMDRHVFALVDFGGGGVELDERTVDGWTPHPLARGLGEGTSSAARGLFVGRTSLAVLSNQFHEGVYTTHLHSRSLSGTSFTDATLRTGCDGPFPANQRLVYFDETRTVVVVECSPSERDSEAYVLDLRKQGETRVRLPFSTLRGLNVVDDEGRVHVFDEHRGEPDGHVIVSGERVVREKLEPDERARAVGVCGGDLFAVFEGPSGRSLARSSRDGWTKIAMPSKGAFANDVAFGPRCQPFVAVDDFVTFRVGGEWVESSPVAISPRPGVPTRGAYIISIAVTDDRLWAGVETSLDGAAPHAWVGAAPLRR